MRFEWFVARRYLKGAHRGRTYISTAGVTIGVTVLIVVISVMNGFEREFLGKMLGAYGHLRLIPVENGQVITRLYSYEDWIPRFGKEPGVEGVSPIIESGVMIIAESPRNREPQGQFIQVRGIDPIHEGQASDLIRGRLLGEWPELADTPASASSATKTVLIDPFAVEPKTPPIFLGLELAKELYNAPDNWHWSSTDPRLRDFLESEVMGKKVKLVAPRLDRGPSGQELFFVEAEVKGIFKTGFFDFDLRSALTSLETARILKRLPPDTVEYLEVKLSDPDPDKTFQAALAMIDHASTSYHGSFYGLPWMAINPVLLKAVKIEKVVMGSILTLVVLVAAFGIASTLVMTVLEKTREIGTLMALGARRRTIMSIFVLNGFQVGFFGTLYGLFVGLGICKLIEILKLPMPGGGGVYVLDILPVEIRWLDVAFIILFSVAASTIAGIYPAWKAARLQPVEALSYE